MAIPARIQRLCKLAVVGSLRERSLRNDPSQFNFSGRPSENSFIFNNRKSSVSLESLRSDGGSPFASRRHLQ
jgi:hypothetical protein